MLRIWTLILLGSLTALAQQSGRVSGTVVDPAGAAVPNAKVSLLLENGKSAVVSTTTNSAGIFNMVSVRPETYTLEIEAPNFVKRVVNNIKVDPARESTLPDIALSIANTTQQVEVTGNVQAVDLASAEVATTVTQKQIQNLPAIGRQVSTLFVLQAGVAQNTRANTVINGMRPSYTNLYVDGINIQDSVRLNDLDFIQNRLTIAQVSEFTVSTTNSNPTIGGAASSISLITPSGTNQYHGTVYWFNRNSHFAANDWFNNKNGVVRPFLNENQPGFTFAGPVKRDKIFFFGNYEALRRPAGTPVNNTIMTPTARQGILQYRVGGDVRQFNVLTASGLKPSAYMQALLADVPAAGNNSAIGDGLNTTGYSFNASGKVIRDNVTGKLDYNLTTRHVFAASYAWNRELVDRSGLTPFYTYVPPVSNDNSAKLLSLSYRWTPTPTLTNELRGGYNRAPGIFIDKQTLPANLVSTTLATAGMQFSSPIQTGEIGEGRRVNFYSIQDNANWIKGKHSLSFGFQMFLYKVPSYNFNPSIRPLYTIGISAASPNGFTTASIPGASTTDVSRANGILSTLAGLVSSGTQAFNPTSATSGFVKDAPQINDFRYNNYALYVSDNYKLARRLTLTLGLRWDYFPPVDEANALIAQPLLQNGDARATLLGNATIDLAGKAVGRPLYRSDRNNFAPNIALAWDPFGTGRTSIRAGYNVAFLNDNTLNSVFNALTVNSGLTNSPAIANLNSTIDSPTPIPTPKFQLPTTSKTQFDLTPSAPPVQGMIDPNLATPYVQQWNLTIQHDIKGFIFEGRYVGNHVVKGFRVIDYNQVNIFQGDYLADFLRARNNGFLARNLSGTFNPVYNPAIPGSQVLTFFPRLPSGGALTNAAVQAPLISGEAGSLAQLYQSNLFFPSAGFSYFPNPLTLYSSLMTNQSSSTYNAAQFEVRKRVGGLQFQANYTFSKALTNTFAQRALEALLDNGNPLAEKGVANFDQRHAFKLNHDYALPVGGNHRLHFNKTFDRVLEDWHLAGFVFLYSGNPVGVRSSRGTLNRGARSTENTVDTNLTYSQLRDITGLFMTGNGPYWIEPSHINPSNTQGVGADGAAPFAGQVFFNPQPGSIGSLQRRVLLAPGFKSYNFSIGKSTRITERQRIEIRADFYNLFNHPNFFINDQNINSSGFGRITAQNYTIDGVGPRQVQFGITYKF